MIYLDDAATSKPKDEVVREMLPYLYDHWYNPSSLYNKAVAVRKKIDEARSVVAESINANANEIYFTSGGSESNCWAIQGFSNYIKGRGGTPYVITTDIEHSSITKCLGNMSFGYHVLLVDQTGLVYLNDLKQKFIEYEDILKEYPQVGLPLRILVSVQMANNEIGTIQNIKAISEICHAHNALLHVDAVQAFCKIPIDVNDLGIDMLSASGHKIGAPKGVGFLYIRNGVKISPIIYGSQEGGLRGGTENIAGIMALKRAVEVSSRDIHYQLRMTVLRNNFISELEAMGCKLNGHREQRLPNNINVTLGKNITAESMIYLLEASGIYISAGSACNAHSSTPSNTLKAIGLTDEEALRTIRITLPDDITMDEIDLAANEIRKALVLLG